MPLLSSFQQSAVTSYVIQISSESQRTVRLSMLEAAIFLGGAVGLLSLPFLTDYFGATHAMLFLGVCLQSVCVCLCLNVDKCVISLSFSFIISLSFITRCLCVCPSASLIDTVT